MKDQRQLFSGPYLSDCYMFYSLPEDARKEVLDKWFYTDPSFIQSDQHGWHRFSKVIFKRVDVRTSRRLYNEPMNPVVITQEKYVSESGNMILDPDPQQSWASSRTAVSLVSIDDSSFTIRTKPGDYMDLSKEIPIIRYLDDKEVINGDDLMDLCIGLGFDESTLNYD